MEHPWESLAIVGLAALTLTGIGAVAGAAGLGALSGLGSIGSALFTAELVGTGALLTYKTATGTLDGNDVLMGALSLGPLAAARLFKYTGLGAKLAPKVAKVLGRLDEALLGGNVQKIIKRFEKKLAERMGKGGGKAARGISEVQRESIFARLRNKKWSITDDLTKLSDDELKIVNLLADDLEKMPGIKKFTFIDDSKKGFMATFPDGTLKINKAVAGRDLNYFKSILNHESGHLLHVDPATGRYFSWDKFMQGFENSKVKVPKFNGVEEDLGALEQILADKSVFANNPVLRQEFGEWIREVHIPNLKQSLKTAGDLNDYLPEVQRSLVFANKFDPQLATFINNEIRDAIGNVRFMTLVETRTYDFIDFYDGIKILGGGGD